MKAGPETDLLQRYLERARATGRALGVSEIVSSELPESRAPQVARRCDEEAAAMLSAVHGSAFVIALDENGRDETSEGLAKLIATRLADATPEIAFAIGGPDGHGPAVRRRAALSLAFGRATWPHQLVRVMLAEQLYRAMTILAGHPYHRA